MTPNPESPNPDAIPAVSEPGSAEAEVLFGRYRVERELGRGGMGRVLLAFDTKLRIYVAVKLVPEQLMADAESAEDLRREVLRGIALTHPAIVRTHTFEQDDTGAGIVMEYIDGLTFTEWKEQQPNRCFEPEQLFPWLGPLCEVLDYAHREARIVHRDLKPRNVMISHDGKLKVADFGIAATLTDTHSRVTGQGGTSGTPAYMSPQQAQGKKPSPLDDIYALGATLYDLIAGKPPFFRGTQEVVLMQVVSETPISMTERRAELGIEGLAPIPEVWEQTIAACLAKEPAERPQSCAEVLARLQAPRSGDFQSPTHPAAPEAPIASEESGGLPPAPVGRRLKTAAPSVVARKSKWPLYGGIAAVAILASVAVFLWAKQSKPAGGPRSVAAQASVGDAGGKVGVDKAPPASVAPAATPALAAATPMAATPKPATPAPALTAQPSTPAPSATPKPLSEIEKWLAQVDGIYQPMWQKEVLAPYEKGQADLRKNMLAALDAQIAAASRAAKLPDALALRNERQRIESEQGVPADDSDTPPAALKTLRESYRAQASRLESERQKNATRVFEQYDKALATNQNALTQRQRLDEALQLQQRRDRLKTEWLAPAPSKAPEPRENLAAATKEQPFVNSLGMKFVPVPGTDILLCIHETRRKDYAAFAEAAPGVDTTWKSPTGVVDGKPLDQNEEHPVVQVSWNDATAFCEWLSKKEGRTYRLPSEHEWNLSVVTGLQDPRALSAAALLNVVAQQYPWESGRDEDGIKHGNYDGNADGFEGTAPVMSFLPNALGFYDLGGNAWEWCDGWFDADQEQRVLRGCGYRNMGGFRRSHNRQKTPADFRVAALNDFARRIPGFRCALVIPAKPAQSPTSPAPATPAPVTTASPAPSATPVRLSSASLRPDPALTKATKDAPFVNSLGMNFVPVPGTKVLFCIHETRYKEYAAFAAENPGLDSAWKNQTVDGWKIAERADEHPVIWVRWEEAKAFCVWLSQKEKRTYRLPTDREWSFAVGIGNDENWTKGMTPQARNGQVTNAFPWGRTFPPKTIDRAGNYADTSFAEHQPGRQFIEGYTDGFVTTAPVMSFVPNRYGLFDLGGNVGEWCEDFYNVAEDIRTSRGGGWSTRGANRLDHLSSSRHMHPLDRREPHVGFRVVVELPDR